MRWTARWRSSWFAGAGRSGGHGASREGKVKTRSLKPEGCGTRLTQQVGAVSKKVEEAEVAEDLELLADFGSDVAIGRMKSRELWFE